MSNLHCRFKTLEEYEDLKLWLESLKKAGKIAEWADAVRYLVENDLFFLAAEVLSDGQVIHSDTGKRFLWHQFYVDMCRQTEYQISKGGGLDASSRGASKSTIRTKAGNIQRMIRYPNSTGCIFSFQRKSSRKHFLGIKEELETNEILRTVCDDVFYWDPRSAAKNGETHWSKEEGLRVKRRPGVVYRENTLEYNAFFDGTPTGGRYDWLDFDDIEDDKAIGTEEMIDKLHKTYDTTMFVLTAREIKPPVMMFTNTFYHDGALAHRVYKQLLDESADSKVEKFGVEQSDLTRVVPGEDLSKPGGGPLGGSAVYPFTLGTLHNWYKKLDDPRTYAAQICCSLRAGSHRSFSEDWLLTYTEKPETAGRHRNIYICIDPSRGVKDPTVIWVWGLGPDRKAMWLDVSMKWLDPALPEFQEEVLRMVARWSNLGKRIVEIRVENFGQSTYASAIAIALRNNGYNYPVISCADNVRTHKFSSGKKDREFERWAGPAKNGDVMIPLSQEKGGAGLVRDLKGKNTDLVKFFLDREWKAFPNTSSDNMLDAGSLLWEPEDKMGAPLQYPAFSIRQSIANAYRGTSSMSMG